MMLLYLSIGAGVAAARVFLSLLGAYSYERSDLTWILAKATTDIMWWWLVLLLLLLHMLPGVRRVQH